MEEIDFDELHRQKLKAECENARRVLKDPNADQLARDLAHLRLKDEHLDSSSVGYGSWVDASRKDGVLPPGTPSEWLTVEAYELGLAVLSEEEIVALAEDPLVLNKCKTIKALPDRNGRPSIMLAYPKLTRAVISQLKQRNDNIQAIASANAVMACLVRAEDRAGSLKYFQNAILVRPDDWKLRNAIASAYMSVGNTSLALEALTRAVELTVDGSFEQFEVESCRSKVLFNLERYDEAKKSLLSVIVNSDKFTEQLDPLDVGHLVVNQYMLCCIFGVEKNRKMCKAQWDRAEEKRDALSLEVRQRIDWDSRNVAQTLMGALDSNLLNQQECHHCRKLCEDPMRCTGCKAALYCSRTCQVAAWKAGHKKECQQAKEERKEQKKEKKVLEAKIEAVNKLPPFDAKLEPHALWAKAKKLSQQPGKAEDAVFYFCVALFLDFSLDANNLEPAKAAVEACKEPDHPLPLALGIITHMKKYAPLEHAHDKCVKALEYLRRCGDDEFDTSETLEEINRIQFGFALSQIFTARTMGRCYSVTSREQAESEEHRRAFMDILKLLNDAKTNLSPSRWLTMQFELGYSYLDVGAANEASHWLETFVNDLAKVERDGGKLSKHWLQMRKKARMKLQMAQLMVTSMRRGIMPA